MGIDSTKVGDCLFQYGRGMGGVEGTERLSWRSLDYKRVEWICVKVFLLLPTI